jgi:hypothetical protein
MLVFDSGLVAHPDANPHANQDDGAGAHSSRNATSASRDL